MPQINRHIDIANRIIELIQSEIGLLSPFTSGDVRYEDPESKDVNWGIVVAPLDEMEGRGTNGQDDIGYRFIVRRAIAKTSSGDSEAARSKSVFRNIIRLLFHRKRIGIECELITKVRHGAFVLKGRYKKGSYDITAMVITTWIREIREFDGE